MEKIAVFPGSFDPFTIGHESIVRRSMSLFDKVIIMIGYNSNKNAFFSLEKRKKLIEKVFSDDDRITVQIHKGLTIDCCTKNNARYLLRGIRTSADFEYERAIAQVNKKMSPEIETVFLLTLPEHTPVNSTIVRDILYHRGDASMFLPSHIDLEDLINEEVQ